jgi:hypothetical protein
MTFWNSCLKSSTWKLGGSEFNVEGVVTMVLGTGNKNENQTIAFAISISSYGRIGQMRPLQSKVSRYSMSSLESSKSKMSKFSMMRDLVTDLGMVTLPLCN